MTAPLIDSRSTISDVTPVTDPTVVSALLDVLPMIRALKGIVDPAIVPTPKVRGISPGLVAIGPQADPQNPTNVVIDELTNFFGVSLTANDKVRFGSGALDGEAVISNKDGDFFSSLRLGPPTTEGFKFVNSGGLLELLDGVESEHLDFSAREIQAHAPGSSAIPSPILGVLKRDGLYVTDPNSDVWGITFDGDTLAWYFLAPGETTDGYSSLASINIYGLVTLGPIIAAEGGYLSVGSLPNRYFGKIQDAGDPTTTHLPNHGDVAQYKNLTSGALYLAANDGGAIKKLTFL